MSFLPHRTQIKLPRVPLGQYFYASELSIFPSNLVSLGCLSCWMHYPWRINCTAWGWVIDAIILFMACGCFWLKNSALLTPESKKSSIRPIFRTSKWSWIHSGLCCLQGFILGSAWCYLPNFQRDLEACASPFQTSLMKHLQLALTVSDLGRECLSAQESSLCVAGAAKLTAGA